MAPKKKRIIINAARGALARRKRKISSRAKLIKILKGKLKNVKGLKNVQDVLMKYDLFNWNSAGRRFLLHMAKSRAKQACDRVYTGDEKAICLAILKQNPAGYRLLSKCLPLPSPHTLTNALGKIPVWPGINHIIFDNLKERATKLSSKDKICSLIFAEMSLKASLTYMSKYGIIIGLENFGGDSGRGRLADNVLMFMLRGVRCKWTQPIAFYFCESTVKTSQLVHCIKEVLQAVFETDLKVQVTVCHHGKTNVAAINLLIHESRANFIRDGREFRSVGFYFKNWEIIHIYDPPHLMKSVRNNLLTKNLTFNMDSNSFKASWTAISKFYSWDCSQIDRSSAKLTDRHIIAQQIPKKKLKYAVQVLSYSVAAVLDRCLHYEPLDGPDQSCVAGTSKCCEFFDALFDSVNSRRRAVRRFKPLDCLLSTGSAHLDFWRKARNIFSTMKFVDTQGHVTDQPTCIQNWSFTLRGFEALWNILQNQGFSHVCLKNINQDPLENFFDQVLSHGNYNTRPTCSEFIGSFKTIIINTQKLARKNSFNYADDGGSMLTLLKDYLDGSRHIPVPATERPKIDRLAYLEDTTRSLNAKILKYVEDFVARRLSKIVHCAACKSKLIDSTVDPTKFTFIRDKKIIPGSHIRPIAPISVAFPKVCNVVWNIIPDVIHMREIRAMIIDYINLYFDMTFLDCNIHNLSNVFILNVVNYLLFKWVELRNKKLCPKGLQVESDMDHFQRSAITKYGKNRSPTTHY